MKNSSLISKLFMAAVTLGIFAYFGVQAYHYFDDPMFTTLAYTYQRLHGAAGAGPHR